MARQARLAVVRIADLGSRALARASRNLGPRDRRRFSRMRSAKRRREFLAGRALLALHGVEVDSEKDGSLKAKNRVGASVSHARGWVACVVVPEGRAGIDIEPMVERDFAKLSRYQFGAVLARRDFYEQWTRRESRIKAFGDGERRDSHRESFYLTTGGIAVSVCVPRAIRVPRSLRALRRGRSGG